MKVNCFDPHFTELKVEYLLYTNIILHRNRGYFDFAIVGLGHHMTLYVLASL